MNRVAKRSPCIFSLLSPTATGKKMPSVRLAIHFICAGFPDSQMPQFPQFSCKEASAQTDGNLAAHLQ